MTFAASGRSTRGATFLLTALLVVPLAACGADTPDDDAEAPDAAPARASGAAAITAEGLARYTQELADDRFQGRKPAGTGEAETLAYLQAAYEHIGLDSPSGTDNYLQEVGLVAISAEPATAYLSFVGSTEGAALELRYGPDFVTWTTTPQAVIDVAGNMVFVGYGVSAPEENWNDYGDTDVTGKVLLMLVNDPPLEDQNRFGGPAMTYYGRWTYKFEEGARRGAAGVLLIHTTESAGYAWQTVEASWTGEQLAVPLAPESTEPVALQGWLTEDTAARVFAAAGLDFGELAAAAATQGFEPVELGLIAAAHLDSTSRSVISYNVIGEVRGDDPEHADEYVIFTSHWDHFGVGAAVDGDAIYNGALDNAVGVAGLLQIAEAWMLESPAPRRSALFIATTAEEQGLLGSAYYVENPLVPLDQTLATINMDGANIWGPTEDVTIIGLGNSTLDDFLTAVLADQGRTVIPDPESEKGFFYRSDHFPFARAGVPALYTDTGTSFLGKPAEFAEQVRNDYTSNRYHMPSDEYDATWDLSGAAQDFRALFTVGLLVAAANTWPEWGPGNEFRATRKAMLEGR